MTWMRAVSQSLEMHMQMSWKLHIEPSEVRLHLRYVRLANTCTQFKQCPARLHSISADASVQPPEKHARGRHTGSAAREVRKKIF